MIFYIRWNGQNEFILMVTLQTISRDIQVSLKNTNQVNYTALETKLLIGLQTNTQNQCNSSA